MCSGAEAGWPCRRTADGTPKRLRFCLHMPGGWFTMPEGLILRLAAVGKWTAAYEQACACCP